MPALPSSALLPIEKQTRETFVLAKDSVLGQVQVTNELGLRYLDADINFGAVGVEEVFQNVKYILLTEYYSVPLDREFGMDFSMIDKPIPIAEAILSQEVAMKIALYEPRAVFEEISFDGSVIDGKLSPTVVIGIASTDELQSMYGPTLDVVTTAPVSPVASVVYPEGGFSGRITGLQGPPGLAATIQISDTITGAPGTNASVVNTGDQNNAILEFTIPRGNKGDEGDTGTAATIAVGTTATGSAGSLASVTNIGTSSAAIFNFIIPQGIQGDKGDKGDKGDIGPIGTMPVGTVLLFTNSVTIPSGWLVCDGSAVSRTLFSDLFAICGTTYGVGDDSTTFNLPDLRGRVSVGVGQGAGLTSRVIGAVGGEEVHQLTVAELASHAHGVNDPTHAHSVSDPGHVHYMDHYHLIGSGQFNHSHSIYDPTHAHMVDGVYTANLAGGSLANAVAQVGPYAATDSRPTGVATYGATLPDGSTVYASTTYAAWVNTGAAGTGIGIWGAATGISIQNTGSDAAHNTMQPFLVLQYIVKAVLDGGSSAQAPIANTTQDGLLRKVSGLTTDFVRGDNTCADLGAAVRNIVAVSTRSFNSIGNPTFEVDQRNVGGAIALAPGVVGWVDRWQCYLTGTMRVTSQQVAANVNVPETNFCITSKILRFTLTTQQATLDANDSLIVWQGVEGSRLRELINDVHSPQILVRSSVDNLKFGLILCDGANPAIRVLAKLCTLGAANTWTLVKLPNLPVFPAGSIFPVTPGTVGYWLGISLAAGSSQVVPVDAWQNISINGGAVGQSNFAASPLDSTFELAFIQHEPGSTCGQLIDLPFESNLISCQRQYCKMVGYYTLPCQGNWMMIGTAVASTTAVRLNVKFPVEMAKSPTIRMCGVTPDLNNVYVDNQGTNAISGAIAATSAGMNYLTVVSATPAGNQPVLGDWDASTGW